MTVSLTIEEMTREEKPAASHEYNYFLDRQLQNKLLSLDEESLDNPLRNQSSTTTENKTNKSYNEITGWTPTKIVFRKPERENKVSSGKELNPWRDYNNKAKQQIQDNFLFKHYADHKEYIAQYRMEHSCIAAMMSPSNKELTEMRKIAIQNTAPSQVQVRQTMCNQCNTVTSSVQNLLTAALQYSNRRDGSYTLSNTINNVINNNSNNSSSQRQPQYPCYRHNNANDTSSQSYKYKMSPDVTRRPESQHSAEAEKEKPEVPKPSRISSAKNPRSAGKTPTRVTVPNTGTTGAGHLKHQPLQTVTLQGAKDNGPIQLPVYNGNVRTLDTLACVATDKQQQKFDRPFKMSLQVLSLSHLTMDAEPPVQGYSISPRSSSRAATPSLQQLRRSKSDATKNVDSFQGQGHPLRLWHQEQGQPVQLWQLEQGHALQLRQQDQGQSSVLWQQEPNHQKEYFEKENLADQYREVQIAKQVPWQPEQEEEVVLLDSNHVADTVETPVLQVFNDDNQSHSECGSDSVEKLSTICLVSPEKPSTANKLSQKLTDRSNKSNTNSPRLEHSATYPVFPTNFSLDNNVSVLNTGSKNVWNQSSSEVFPKHSGLKKEFTFHAPFKNVTTEIRKIASSSAVDRVGSCDRPVSVFVRPNDKVGFPDIRSENKVSFLVTANMHKAEPGKENESSEITDTYRRSSDSVLNLPHWKAVELPNFKHLQMKNLRNKYSGYILNRRKSSSSRTKSSASSVSHSSASFKHTNDGTDSPNVLLSFAAALPHDSNFSHDRKSQSSYSSTDSMKKVADYLLKENKKSGSGEIIDDGENVSAIPKADVAELHVPPNLEGLTWCEKLELLRSVNKRDVKKQNRVPKLRFVKDLPLQIQATSFVKPTVTNQLYQQRRIKHLLLQARMKGVEQFDWLKESPRYRNSSSISDSESLSGDSDYGEHSKGDNPFGAGMEVSAAEKALLSRYNMPSVVKDTGWKAMPQAVQRSNTTVYQS